MAREVMVLATSHGRDVGGDAGIDEDVLLAHVRVEGKAAEDLEAMGVVDMARNVTQRLMQVGQRGEGRCAGRWSRGFC